MYQICNPTIEDGNEMWGLAERAGLDVNSSYSYLMMANFFNDRCFVMKDGEKVIGFATGFILKDDIYFIWQICVDPEYQGEGLSYRLLEFAIDSLVKKQNVRFVQATVSPENSASMGLFKKTASKNKTFFATREGFSENDFPDDKPEEKLIQVGPLNMDY